MKNFKKVFLTCALAAGIVAAASAAASAEELTAAYDAAANTVTLAGVTAQDQNSMVILNGEDVAVTSETILAIDQVANGEFAAIPVKALADGKYLVKVGGTDGSIQTYVLEVGEPTPPAPAYKLGDVNRSGEVNATDAGQIVLYDLGKKVFDAEQLALGDVNASGEVNATDAGQIVLYDLGKKTW